VTAADTMQEFGCDAHDADDPVLIGPCPVTSATAYDERSRIDALGRLEAAAGRGLDGTGLDGRVLFGDPHDLWSLGSAEVEPTLPAGSRVHLDLLLPTSVAEEVIALVVRGEQCELSEAVEEVETDAEWAARAARELASLVKGPPRLEVQRFAEIMEDKLVENDGKRGWRRNDAYQLHDRLLEEAAELRQAMTDAGGDAAPNASTIAREAADVANFAMMIADIAGGLR
jgi:NTP pyrophosphatase (non-canonical NTP hydrolase)